MKVTVVVTVLNEEPTIAALLESLLNQTRKADEIVFVDGGSSDKTADIIRRYQKYEKNIHLYEFHTTRAEARNIGIRSARNNIIATTDAGCLAEKHWLKRLTDPFVDANVDMVAGFYEMIGNTPFRKALSVFLGVTPSKFDDHFLASARSLAFRKELWNEVGGFPENLKDTAEDTMFNLKIINTGANIVRVKNAVVYWKLPATYWDSIKKMYLYAKGDAKSGIWWHPVKRFSTHNIKIAFIYARYFLGLFLLFLSLYYHQLEFPIILALVFYIFWAFKKVYTQTDSWRSGFCGILLQFTSDLAVMSGFFIGAAEK